MLRVLVSGAGRGIGLEVARQYAERGDRVLAGSRALDRSPGLQQLLNEHPDQVTVLPLEVTSDDSIAESVRLAKEAIDGLDVLINNAAISPGDSMLDRPDGRRVMDAERALEMLKVNAVAPIVVAQSFLGLLERGTNPRIVNVSSGAGSLTYKKEGGLYSYSASKSALNMYSLALAWDLRDRGIAVIMLDPGWVKTDLGGPNAHIEAPESAQGILRVIDGITLERTGEFLHYQGGTVPW